MNLMEALKQKKQQIQAASGQREKTVKPSPGKTRWRILPTWRTDGNPEFWHDFGQHFIKGLTPSETGSYLKSVYVCTMKTYGKPCPICSAIEEGIRQSTNDDVVKALNDSKAGNSILMNALARDGEDPNTPVILEVRPSVFKQIIEIIETYEQDITDLDDGIDIVISREGKGLNTKYSVMPAPKSAAVDKSVMSKLHNLDDYVAQEHEEAKQRALGAVTDTAGVALAAPAAGALASPTSGEVMPRDVTPAAPSSVTADDSEFEDVDFATPGGPAPVEAEAPPFEPNAEPEESKSATPPPASNDDLEALLSDLDG